MSSAQFARSVSMSKDSAAPTTAAAPSRALVLLLATGGGLAVASLSCSQPMRSVLGADIGASTRAIGFDVGLRHRSRRTQPLECRALHGLFHWFGDRLRRTCAAANAMGLDGCDRAGDGVGSSGDARSVVAVYGTGEIGCASPSRIARTANPSCQLAVKALLPGEHSCPRRARVGRGAIRRSRVFLSRLTHF